MYAENLLLISSPIVNLQCMLNICTEYILIMGTTFGHGQI